MLLLVLTAAVIYMAVYHRGTPMVTGGSSPMVTEKSSPRVTEKSSPTIYTIGHSTQPLAEFVQALTNQHITLLIDVRTLPGSDRYPQYNKEALAKSLPRHGIRYQHIPELGGLRKSHADSINMGWRNKSFRGYADYMQTREFESALDSLMQIASKDVVCIMCSEAVPWRCHRSMIGDALTIRGWRVIDIIGERTSPHRMTPFAVVDGTHVTYPATPVKN